MSALSTSSGRPLNLENIVLKASLHKDNFNFAHINPGSLKPHLSEVRCLLDGTVLHVLEVSETWFGDNHNDNLLAINGFDLLRHDRKRKRGGGVALYVRSGLKYKILSKSASSGKVEYLFAEIDNR